MAHPAAAPSRQPETGQRFSRRAFAAGALALTMIAAGCTSGSGGTGPGEKVTLSYAFWDENQAPAMQAIIDEFTAANPDIAVQTQVTPWEQYWTKLQTSATGGSAPDVFWMTNAYFPAYADGGALMSLQDMVDGKLVDMAHYVDAMSAAYTWEGKVYGIPKDVDTIGLWYNKLLFDEAGLDYPDENWTWEDVKAAARKLTDKDKGVHGIAAPVADQTGYYETIPQAGGYVISPDGTTSGYDSPAAISAIQYWVDMVKDGSSPSVQQMTDTDPESMFTSGKVAMLYNGSWAAIQFSNVPYAKKNVDVVSTPKNVQPGGVINGLANSMYARTKHKDAATKFLQFLGSERAARIQAETGAVIPAFKGTTEAWVRAYPNFQAQHFVDSLAIGSPMPASLKTADWRSFAEQEFTKAWTGEESVAAVAKRVADHMNAVLAEEKAGG